jgi:DNA-binding CsgD family transcriptional regulator
MTVRNRTPAGVGTYTIADRCEPRLEPDPTRLRFGLTPQQTYLTALLWSERTIKEADAVLGATEGNARKYLKAVFRKTRARPRADLFLFLGNGSSLQV